MTKKKTELTTTKQIETRVKRQIVLEDGKVIEDSGPIVETNTTEDTNKQESESVEVSKWIPKIIQHNQRVFIFRSAWNRVKVKTMWTGREQLSIYQITR